jgi:hypothetical protein
VTGPKAFFAASSYISFRARLEELAPFAECAKIEDKFVLWMTPIRKNCEFGLFHARVAKLADAPDLGFRNHRFQNSAFHFKERLFYERKTHFFTKSFVSTIHE